MALDLTRVDSVNRAVAILAAEPAARFMGGGTILVRQLNYGDGAIERVVLSDGLGLDRIETRGSLVSIGAATTMAKIAAEPELDFLKPVAESIGGPAIRNMATLGGNLFAHAPYGDFAVALLALDASVTFEAADGQKTVDIETFLSGRGRRASRVVRSVAFDIPPRSAFRFAKVVRHKPHGASVLAIAAMLPLSNGRLGGVRIAYGAMAPTAIRARAVEKALEGKALEAAAIEAAAKVATEGCAPATDAFATGWYRLNVLPVHLRRLLAG